MSDSAHDPESGSVDHAIALAEALLKECDRLGLVFAAIDIASAIDKMKQAKT